MLPQANRMMNSQDGDTAFLLAKAQALSSRIAAVNEIATAINRSLELDEILRIVGKKAKWLIDFEHLSVYLGEERFITLFGSPVAFNAAFIAPEGAIGYAVKFSQPQLIQNNKPAFLEDYQAGIVIPLENQNKILGTLNFASSKGMGYTLDDVRIAYLLAVQLASAIANAERFYELKELYHQLQEEKRKSENLLLNILPVKIADQLKQSGKVEPVSYECASVLFADFKDFTKLSEILTPEELFNELDYCYCYFDQIIDKYNLEKLKTMGDGYMCAGGIPTPNRTHAIDAVLAAWEMQIFMYLLKAKKIKNNQPYWDLRVGIHSGPLVAGVVGRKKFAYDVWGDTVNTASRMESSGLPGKVNISGETYEFIKDFFQAEYRGKILAKNKGEIDMYLILGIQEHLAIDPAGRLPNEEFIKQYLAIDSETQFTAPFCDWMFAL